MGLSPVEWIIVVFTVLLIIYIIGSLLNNGKILSSKQCTGTKAEGCQFYYLPTASLEIAAKATIIVFKNAAGTIVKTKLGQIILSIVPKIIPDTLHLYVISYESSGFGNDTISVTVGSSGLLEGVNLTAEDRLSGIIDQIATAPQIIMGSVDGHSSPLAAAGDEPLTAETREVQNNFVLSPEQVRSNYGKITWKIIMEGLQQSVKEVDASFTISLKTGVNGKTVQTTETKTAEVKNDQRSPEKLNEVDGIFTRTLTTLDLEIKADDTILNECGKYSIVIPDEASLFRIPLTRTSFVRKNYTIKMSGGILTEAGIVKPSEYEGFVGIPIKIAKAIASVPAQLLSFKIAHIQKETAFLSTQQAMAKAELAGRKDALSLEAELLKTKLENQKTILAYETNISNFKLETQKSFLTAEKNLLDAQQALIKSKQELEKLVKGNQ